MAWWHFSVQPPPKLTAPQKARLRQLAVSRANLLPSTPALEASAMLRQFKVVIKQDGQEHDLYLPLARIVDDEWEWGLGNSAKMASIKCAKFSIVHSELPVEDAREANTVAVRLRQGDARHQIAGSNTSARSTRRTSSMHPQQ